MSTIKKLPQYLINRLKAWEIVERPASVVKELLENSLDAWATVLTLDIQKWGKVSIKITDNGIGIAHEQLPLAVERYATSKIDRAQDLETIVTYWFRWEALATIAEVSGFRMQTRSADTPIPWVWYELSRVWWAFTTKEIPFATEQWTIVYVEDIFRAVPAREKFLKADATEWWYIKKLFVQYALMHRDKDWTLIHNNKHVFSLRPAASFLERVLALTKKDREGKLRHMHVKQENCEVYGLVWDASLHFPKGDRVHIFVNKRPVQDRLIKKALMQAYQRQIVPWTYPFALVCIDIDPSLVDVNVHPRKNEVKFLDPGSMFTLIKHTIQDTIGQQRVNYAAFQQKEVRSSPHQWKRSAPSSLNTQQMKGLKHISTSHDLQGSSYATWHQQNLDLVMEPQVSYSVSSWWSHDQESLVMEWEYVRIVGQVWDSYILLQGEDDIYRVDQHALAERIAFERMKKEVECSWFESEVLLQPLTLTFPASVNIEQLLLLLSRIGFDASLFGNTKIIVHAIPVVFVRYKVAIELVFWFLWTLDEADLEAQDDDQLRWVFDLLLDEILGMKACKASIKAGQKLHMQEMHQLIKDGREHIAWFFVCQHGRPSIVRVQKKHIDGLFDR